jgi:hypothetical protein
MQFINKPGHPIAIVEQKPSQAALVAKRWAKLNKLRSLGQILEYGIR